MSLPSFTVDFAQGLWSILPTLISGELGELAASGATVRFEHNIPPRRLITYQGRVYPVPEPVRVTVAADGTLRGTGDPIKLLANAPGLSATGIQWTYTVKVGQKILDPLTFTAPADDAVVDLGSVVTVAPAPSQGVAFSEAELVTLLGRSTSAIRAALDVLYAPGITDEYHEYANLAAFPATGVGDRIYVAQDSGKFYRWTGSAYAIVSDTDVAAVTHGAASKATPVDNDELPLVDSASSFTLRRLTFGNLKAWVKSWIAKADVGLGSVDNTSDANKPVSTAQAAADSAVASAAASALSSHAGNTSNPHGVTKTQVGLGNVDNTADSAKPVSTAQAAADAAVLSAANSAASSGDSSTLATATGRAVAFSIALG